MNFFKLIECNVPSLLGNEEDVVEEEEVKELLASCPLVQDTLG